MGVTVLNLDDKLLLQFVQVIASDPAIRMPSVVKTKARPDELEARLVPCEPHPRAKQNNCWFNCRSAAASMSGGSVVFGWHVFKMDWVDGPVSFAAGHHAVVERNGAMVNVTPQIDSHGQLLAGATLFVPDSRVPFDYEGLRTVPALHWSPATKEKFWSTAIMDPLNGKLLAFHVLNLNS